MYFCWSHGHFPQHYYFHPQHPLNIAGEVQRDHTEPTLVWCDRQGTNKRGSMQRWGGESRETSRDGLCLSALRRASSRPNPTAGDTRDETDWSSLRGREGSRSSVGAGNAERDEGIQASPPWGSSQHRSISISTTSAEPFLSPHGQLVFGDAHCCSLGCELSWGWQTFGSVQNIHVTFGP